MEQSGARNPTLPFFMPRLESGTKTRKMRRSKQRQRVSAFKSGSPMDLDLTHLRQKCLEIREVLLNEGYRTQIVMLFGSHAKGTASAESDIDLAFVSRDFGKNPFKESSLLNKLLYKQILSAEAVAIPLLEFMDPFPISPIVWEVKKTGFALF
jgi:predicted nucleotidyltransferase